MKLTFDSDSSLRRHLKKIANICMIIINVQLDCQGVAHVFIGYVMSFKRFAGILFIYCT